jgi:hypothetical protein
MKWSMSSIAILVAVSSVAVGAQSGGTMAKGDKMDKMDAMEKGTIGKSTSTLTVKSLKMIAATCS